MMSCVSWLQQVCQHPAAATQTQTASAHCQQQGQTDAHHCQHVLQRLVLDKWVEAAAAAAGGAALLAACAAHLQLVHQPYQVPNTEGHQLHCGRLRHVFTLLLSTACLLPAIAGVLLLSRLLLLLPWWVCWPHHLLQDPVQLRECGAAAEGACAVASASCSRLAWLKAGAAALLAWLLPRLSLSGALLLLRLPLLPGCRLLLQGVLNQPGLRPLARCCLHSGLVGMLRPAKAEGCTRGC